MKLLTYYILWLQALLCYGLQAQELSQDEAGQLLSLPFEKAKMLLDKKRAEYLDNPKYSRPITQKIRADLYDDALNWYGKNPQVRSHYEDFFSKTPHTLATGRKRTRVFNELNALKTEWVARLMIKEVLIDRSEQEFDNTPDPPLTLEEKIELVSRSASSVFRNDQRAAGYLIGLELRGMPSLIRGRNLPKGYLESIRAWSIKNEKQLADLLKERWGDKAVLNEDMSNYVGKLQPAGKARFPGRLDAESAKELRDSRDHDERGDKRGFSTVWYIWALAGVGLLILGCFFIHKIRVVGS